MNKWVNLKFNVNLPESAVRQFERQVQRMAQAAARNSILENPPQRLLVGTGGAPPRGVRGITDEQDAAEIFRSATHGHGNDTMTPTQPPPPSGENE